ncbi:lysophosphatidic acid receptor 1-like [Rhineura floridana]|uniref:lysophosphatidic acid receptor 1-like n=1 Tax=Rhineura floridana TaxID=261503 RepID=UPI002AC811F0|nr:lysophosphatidic acid receptor 1-like [Rhineura floridana]
MFRYQNCLNRTTQDWSRHLVLALGAPQLTITLISAVFNSAVIVAIVYSKALHKPICILFCNLAISDLLSSSSGFWIALLFITNPQSTILGSKVLLGAYTFYTMSILATIYNLVVIGIERYLVVVESLRTRWRLNRNQVLGVASGIWGLAFFLGFMPLMGWNCLDKANVSLLYSPLCIDYLIFITVPHSAVALVLPFFTYFNIIGFLRKHKMAMGVLGQANNTYRLAEIQVTKTSVFIWLLALLSYTPFFVGVLFDLATHQCPSDLSPGVYVFRNLTAMMITMNSLGNPIIYTLKMKKLGHRLKFLKCPSNNRIEVQAIGKV